MISFLSSGKPSEVDSSNSNPKTTDDVTGESLASVSAEIKGPQTMNSLQSLTPEKKLTSEERLFHHSKKGSTTTGEQLHPDLPPTERFPSGSPGEKLSKTLDRESKLGDSGVEPRVDYSDSQPPEQRSLPSQSSAPVSDILLRKVIEAGLHKSKGSEISDSNSVDVVNKGETARENSNSGVISISSPPGEFNKGTDYSRSDLIARPTDQLRLGVKFDDQIVREGDTPISPGVDLKQDSQFHPLTPVLQIASESILSPSESDFVEGDLSSGAASENVHSFEESPLSPPDLNMGDTAVEPSDSVGGDEIPIKKAEYNIDWDNLDNLDPFKSKNSGGIPNSPTKIVSIQNGNDPATPAAPVDVAKEQPISPPRSKPTKPSQKSAPKKKPEPTVEKVDSENNEKPIPVVAEKLVSDGAESLKLAAETKPDVNKNDVEIAPKIDAKPAAATSMASPAVPIVLPANPDNNNENNNPTPSSEPSTAGTKSSWSDSERYKTYTKKPKSLENSDLSGASDSEHSRSDSVPPASAASDKGAPAGPSKRGVAEQKAKRRSAVPPGQKPQEQQAEKPELPGEVPAAVDVKVVKPVEPVVVAPPAPVKDSMPQKAPRPANQTAVVQPMVSKRESPPKQKPPQQAPAQSKPAINEDKPIQPVTRQPAAGPAGPTKGGPLDDTFESTTSRLSDHNSSGGSAAEPALDEEEFVMASSDMFDDPSALDYLSNFGNADQTGVESALYRQSLFTKFDPLIKGPSPAGPTGHSQKQIRPGGLEDMDLIRSVTDEEDVVMDEAKDRHEGDDLLQMQTPPSPTLLAKKGNVRTPVGALRQDSEDSADTPPTVLRKTNKPQASTKPNVRQPKQKVAPVAADGVGGLESVVDENDTPVAPQNKAASHHQKHRGKQSKYLLDETDVFENSTGNAVPRSQLEQLTQTLRLQYQSDLVSKEKEWKAKVAEKERLLKQKEDEMTRARLDLEEMNTVISEYEKIIQQQLSDSHKYRNESGESMEEILKQREQTVEDLSGVENSFAELHRRYEKLKTTVDEYKNNEEQLKTKLNDYQAKLKRAEDRFHRLKEQAEDKLDKANAEIDRLQMLRETDTLGLRAQLKKADVQIESLEKSLDQKNKEILELTAICDELISKAASRHRAE